MRNKLFWNSSQTYRWITAALFTLIVACIGIQFVCFDWQLENGKSLTIHRPPGVEAFLPIGALVSLKYWIVKGYFNTIHPAGLVILLIVCLSALFFKRGFCSWVCPIGLLSDFLGMLRSRIFKRPPHLPKWLDFVLRIIKYFLLFFFVLAIFRMMDIREIERFLNSPYNKISDIKMLKFFLDMSLFTGVVLSFLVLMSIMYENFWCRYLCPYGALVGIVGVASIFKIHRQSETCTNCKKCTRACPSQIRVHEKSCIRSLECTTCLKCVDACPVKNTVRLSVVKNQKTFPAWYVALFFIGIFLIGTTAARLSGHWDNAISEAEYRFHVKNIALPYYDCNRGTVADYSGYKPRQNFNSEK